MALWYCRGCTAAYAVGLEACPQCGATDHVRRREGLPSRELAGAGPAVNLLTGQVTPPGRPLPEIPPEPDSVLLEPSAGPARRARKAARG